MWAEYTGNGKPYQLNQMHRKKLCHSIVDRDIQTTQPDDKRN